jgi:heme exporter protein D
MSQQATHALYIWLSYGVVGGVVAALVAWVLLDGRRLARQLARLEAAGVRRRSPQASDRNTATS